MALTAWRLSGRIPSSHRSAEADKADLASVNVPTCLEMEPGFDGGPGSSYALNAALLVLQQTIVAAKSRASFFASPPCSSVPGNRLSRLRLAPGGNALRGVRMPSSEYYHRQADICVRMALSASSYEERVRLMEVAHDYRDRASRGEAFGRDAQLGSMSWQTTTQAG